MPDKRGLLLVLSGPSGVGKGTVCAALREMLPDLVYSVSATTRPPREGEQDGVNYFFKTKEEFQRMIEEDAFLEWATYVNNYYGTPREFVEKNLEQGRDVLLEIEVQGALQVKEKYPEGIFVFLLPPSIGELKNRIQQRGTESDEVISQRILVAQQELRMMSQYDYAVVNDEVHAACEQIRAILMAEHARTKRWLGTVESWLVEKEG